MNISPKVSEPYMPPLSDASFPFCFQLSTPKFFCAHFTTIPKHIHARVVIAPKFFPASRELVMLAVYNAALQWFPWLSIPEAAKGPTVDGKGKWNSESQAKERKKEKPHWGPVLIWIQWPGITGPWRALVSNGICDREQRRGINMLHLTCGHNTQPPSSHLEENDLREHLCDGCIS